MPYTRIDVANQALNLLEAELITSFEDDKAEAETIALVYDDVVRACFASNRWRFATKVAELSRDRDYKDPIIKYFYAFLVPPECYNIIGLFRITAPPALTPNGTPPVWPNRPFSDGRPMKDWDRRGNHIFANHDRLLIEYTTIASEETWPALFADYVAYTLAARVCRVLTGSHEIANSLQMEADGGAQAGHHAGLWAQAANDDIQQYPNHDVIETYELLAARFG